MTNLATSTEGVEDADPARGRAFASRGRHAYLALPAIVVLGLLFVLPVARMVTVSLGLPAEFTVATYREIVTTPGYLRILLTTLEITGLASLISVAVGYPTAYILTTSPRWLTRVCMIALLAPFLTSMLVRMYGWIVILSPTGLLPTLLGRVGVNSVSLLYDRAGVLIGTVYVMLPYAVFTMRAVMVQIDTNLIAAARSLGASGWSVFRSVYLPLSLPGVIASLLLTFVLAIGYFMTPRLMGGPGDQTIASVIENAIDLAGNERLAAALGVVLLALVFLALAVASRLIGLARLLESGPR